MHCIDDKANGIVINHNSDWSGEVSVAWHAVVLRDGFGKSSVDRFECLCSGIDLVAGRFTLIDGPEPPVNVITRTVALAVEGYLRSKLERAVDDLFIDRGKL